MEVDFCVFLLEKIKMAMSKSSLSQFLFFEKLVFVQIINFIYV